MRGPIVFGRVKLDPPAVVINNYKAEEQKFAL